MEYTKKQYKIEPLKGWKYKKDRDIKWWVFEKGGLLELEAKVEIKKE